MGGYEIKFLYDKAALLLHGAGKSHLVIGDIHIGLERKLSGKGVHLYGATEHMARQIKEIVEDNSVDSVIMLGDIKESVLHPDSVEAMLVRRFFSELQGLDIAIAVGNHDSRLGELVDVPVSDEITMGDVAMLHGHIWPSEEAMGKSYIIIAHNHVAVSFVDENGAIYSQKAWLVANVDKKKAAARYISFNRSIRLVVMPAFNDLILGTPVNLMDGRHINPLFRNGIFDFNGADIYAMSGALLGTPLSLGGKA